MYHTYTHICIYAQDVYVCMYIYVYLYVYVCIIHYIIHVFTYIVSYMTGNLHIIMLQRSSCNDCQCYWEAENRNDAGPEAVAAKVKSVGARPLTPSPCCSAACRRSSAATTWTAMTSWRSGRSTPCCRRCSPPAPSPRSASCWHRCARCPPPARRALRLIQHPL